MGKPSSAPRRSRSNQSTAGSLKLEGVKKSLHKQMRKKRSEKQHNRSLIKMYQKMRGGQFSRSIDATVRSPRKVTAKVNQDARCNAIDLDPILRNKQKEDLLFFEDRTGDTSIDTSILSNEPESPPDNAHKRKLATDSPRRKVPRRESTIVLSDEEELITTVIQNTKTPSKQSFGPTLQSSTPIPSKRSKESNVFNISNLSAVRKTSLASNELSRANNLKKHILNLTKDINSKDFITVDLTSCSSENTVIDLDSTGDVSVNSLSVTSGYDPLVTVVNLDEWNEKKKKVDRKKLTNIAEGIAQMNSSEKGRLLEMITKTILTGCKEPRRIQGKTGTSSESKSLEDTYIKQVIVGRGKDYLRSNVYNPRMDLRNRTGLRMIVIDGSNVAMNHGNHKVFSVKGLQICIEFFVHRGHTVKAFVPHFRCKFGKSSDPALLDFLERRRLVVYTPSTEVYGRTVSSYDDRFIVQCAAEFEGVIVSLDRYRDLVHEEPSWRHAIETRHLQYTWVDDMIMFPRDPLGKDGPTLERFLSH